MKMKDGYNSLLRHNVHPKWCHDAQKRHLVLISINLSKASQKTMCPPPEIINKLTLTRASKNWNASLLPPPPHLCWIHQWRSVIFITSIWYVHVRNDLYWFEVLMVPKQIQFMLCFPKFFLWKRIKLTMSDLLKKTHLWSQEIPPVDLFSQKPSDQSDVNEAPHQEYLPDLVRNWVHVH